MKSMFLIVMAAFAASPGEAGTVTVDLKGVRTGTGDLFVSLQTANEFMKPTGSYGQVLRKPPAGAQRIVLRDVKPGTYAVSVWHDVNGNGRWDSGPDGRPLDGWAMVNGNALRGPPRFEQVSFPVDGADKAIALEVRYGE